MELASVNMASRRAPRAPQWSGLLKLHDWNCSDGCSLLGIDLHGWLSVSLCCITRPWIVIYLDYSPGIALLGSSLRDFSPGIAL